MEIRGAPSPLCCSPAMIFGHSRWRIVNNSVLYESTSWLVSFSLFDSGRNDILMFSPWSKSNMKSFLCLLKYSAMKTCGRVEEKLQALLNSVPMTPNGQLHGPATCPSALYMGGHSRSATSDCERKNLCPCQESIWKILALYARRRHYFVCSLVELKILYEIQILYRNIALNDTLRN
jgi:hypothetical protein